MKTVKRFTTKKLIIFFLVFVILFAGLCANIAQGQIASADTNTYKDDTYYDSDSNNEATPIGLYTSLSLSINGSNGRIWATVRNDFTLFPSTVYVIVELYSSDTYFESHTDMQLVSRASIEDLDMNKSISTDGYTGGIQKYWQGRMRYKIDNAGWKTETTGTVLYSADGEFLGIA